MNRKLPLIFTLIALIVSLTHAAPLAAAARSEVRVAQIDIVVKQTAPSEKVAVGAILSKMKTKEGSLFSQVDFDNDLKALSEDYDRVEPHLQFLNNQVFITIDIWTKPHIRSLCFVGNDKVKTKRLQKELGLCPGSLFDRHAFIESFHKLKAYYVKRGYFEAELDYTVTPVPECNEVDITLTICEGRSGKIKRIYFDCFTKEEERKLVEMIHTKQYSLFTSWFTQTGTYHQEALDQDRITIVSFLQNEGYADARVDIQVQEAPEDNRIILTVTADRGEQYSFGKISFSGNTVFTDEQIGRLIRIYEGQCFSPEKLRDTVKLLSTLYGAHGYIESNINFLPRLAEDAPAYDIHFEILEGEPYRVGLVKVFGNSHTQTGVILHECLLIPGDTFDSRKLQATEQRLQNIQYFKNVNVYPVKSQDEKLLGANYRDVHIEVEEDNTGNLSAFFGFSTLDSLFGGIELMERNFNYKGIGRLFKDGPSALRGGGEYLQLKGMIGTKTNSYMVRWVKPYFLDSNWIVSYDLEKSENTVVSRDYNITTWGGRINATYPYNAYLNFGWHYRIRYSSVVVSHVTNPMILEEAKRGGWISGTGLNCTYTRLNSIARPSDGFRSELSFDFNGIGGEYDFLTMSYINTLYVPISSRGTLKFRGDLRFIQVLPNSKEATYYSDGVLETLSRIDSLPLSERFFLGGENSVRGYNGFSIGPKFPNGDPKGGVSSLLLSEEYLHRLFKRVDLFLFVDAGAVSDSQYTIGTVRLSAGYGVRVELFNNIPIIVGMGYPINPAVPGDVRRFFVSLGGRF